MLLLHGGLLHGESAWSHQAPLAARWTLVIPHRAGYGDSAALSDGEDFDLDAKLLAPGLEPGTHVVGHSSGGVAAMLLAARRPDAVASLTLIEPPVFHLAPESAWLVDRSEELFGADRPVVDFLREFFELFRGPVFPDDVLESLAPSAEVWRAFRRFPWRTELPLDQLHDVPFPKLVLSGGYMPEFEAVCDALAVRLGAERAVIEGAGHAVQATGAPFNERLEELFGATELPARPR